MLVASFASNIWLIQANPVATFYSPLTRFWELLCGSLLALYVIRRGDNSNVNSNFLTVKESLSLQLDQLVTNRFLTQSLVSFVGLGLLIVGFYLINKNLEFPGYWALLPILGSVMIIVAGPNAWFNRKILSTKIFVWFGLISFPLYLWHWPLLSFIRILYADTPPLKYRVSAVFLSIVLAWLTMRFVERPLRFGAHKSSLKVFGLSGFLLALSFVGAILFNFNLQGFNFFDKLSERRKLDHAIGSSLTWYRGKDDWLFLGNRYDSTVAKLKLAITPTDMDLSEVKDAFSEVTLAGSKYGVKTVLIMGPNKSSIYPEYLPNEVIPSQKKYSSFFLDKLREIPGLLVYDPTNDLLAAKDEEGLLYWKTDTHWNNKGAYLTFVGFCRLINLEPPNVTFKQGATRGGDLIGISKLSNFPLSPQDNWDVVWNDSPVWKEKVIPNEQKTAFGHSTVVINEKPLSNQYVWVIGDSFVGALKQYFNATFKEVRYVGHWEQKLKTLPEEIVKAERKPDLVVVVRVERSF